MISVEDEEVHVGHDIRNKEHESYISRIHFETYGTKNNA